MLKRLKTIINTVFLKIFFSTKFQFHWKAPIWAPFIYHISKTTAGPSWPTGPPHKTSNVPCPERGRVKIHSPKELGRSEIGSARHHFCRSCLLDGTQRRKRSGRLAPALRFALSWPGLVAAGLPWPPCSWLLSPPPARTQLCLLWALGLVHLLGVINVVFVTLRRWIKRSLPKICS